MYTSTSNISTQCQNVRLDCRAHFRIIYVGNQTQYRSGKVRFVTLDIVPKCPLCQTMLIDGCDKINIATKSRLCNAQRVTASRQRDQMSNYAASGYLGRICRLVCHNNPAIECPAGYQWPFCKNWKIEQSMRNRISSSKVRLHQQDAVKSRCGGRHCEYNELLARDCPGDRGRRQLFSWPRISDAIESYWTLRAILVWYNKGKVIVFIGARLQSERMQ